MHSNTVDGTIHAMAAWGKAARRLRWRTALLLAGAQLVFFSAPAAAHHSAAKFDSEREVVLEGTVRRMEWANPHVWIRLAVEDGQGKVVEWGIEASNPLDLGRKGWTKNTFKAGDKVTITINPAKDDRPFGAFVRATLADGSVLSEGSVTGEEDVKRTE
jgi:hypothetical protein